MRTAIISDIHGNLPALDAVIAAARKRRVDRIVCLGDIVGYGPFPEECVGIVKRECAFVVQGNHDSGLTGETSISDFNQYGVESILWSRDRVSADTQEYLRTLPYRAEVEEMTFVHSSPDAPDRWRYVLSLRAANRALGAFTTRLCFIGHTHVPVVVAEGPTVNRYLPAHRHLINVGSVGQPRDGDPDAAFGLYDSMIDEYELVRVPYDIDRTVDAIRAAGLPEFLGQRLYRGA